MHIRLSKYIADAGVCSRRKAEAEILRGRVTVNGRVVCVLGSKVDTEADTVALGGEILTNKRKLVYIMLHKPEGYVTTVSDEQGRPTVMSLVKGVDARLVPVGRLDYNTSGLLLMTNDGALVYRLTHPRHEVRKTYVAKIEGHPSGEALRRFRSGLRMEEYTTSPAEIKMMKSDDRSATVKITIREGRNRQVRKMCEAIGHRVISLKRVATGDLRLDGLEKGSYRHLSSDEVKALKNL